MEVLVKQWNLFCVHRFFVALSAVISCHFCATFRVLRVNSVFMSALKGYKCVPVCYFFFLIAYIFYAFVSWESSLATLFAFWKKYFSLNVGSVFSSWDFKWVHACKLFVGMGLHSFSCDCIMMVQNSQTLHSVVHEKVMSIFC